MGAPQIINVVSGSSDHFKKRMGRVTASNSYDLLPSKRDGKYKGARETYMNTLVAEICTGVHEEINAKPLEWGKQNEANARAAYQFAIEKSVEPVGMITCLDGRAACSPDLKIIGEDRFGEIKCPWNTLHHINFLLEGEIKDEWNSQVQFSLWVSGGDVWDFASYDPRMKDKIFAMKTIEKDFRLMKIFDEEVPQFIYDLDKKLEKIGIKFGAQWE